MPFGRVGATDGVSRITLSAVRRLGVSDQDVLIVRQFRVNTLDIASQILPICPRIDGAMHDLIKRLLMSLFDQFSQSCRHLSECRCWLAQIDQTNHLQTCITTRVNLRKTRQITVDIEG